MALAHIVALLKKILRAAASTMHEAAEMRRRMARRHPGMEE
jgi:hypothetical protein